MNALQICGICGICVRKKSSAEIYSHADLADLADFLFRYYYAVHECTIDPRNLRGKQKLSGNYSHADLADLADFLFRYYYVVHNALCSAAGNFCLWQCGMTDRCLC